MKVKRDDFSSLLKKIHRGIAENDIVEQMSHVFFTGERIIAYGSEYFTSSPFITDFKCSVTSGDLYAIVDRLEGDISLTLKEKELLISTGKGRAGLPIHDDLSILDGLLLPPDTPMLWNNLPDDFLEGIKISIFSASKDFTQEILTCIHAEGDSLFASDDLRISWYKMKGKIQDTLDLPAGSVQKMIQVPVTSYLVNSPWICFKTDDNFIFGMKKYMGEYPEVKHFFKVTGEGITLPKILPKVISDVSVIIDGVFTIDKRLEVEIQPETIICRTSSGKGWFEKETAYESNLPHTIKFLVNPVFFLQVLEKCTTVTLGKESILFSSPKFKHVLALPI